MATTTPSLSSIASRRQTAGCKAEARQSCWRPSSTEGRLDVGSILPCDARRHATTAAAPGAWSCSVRVFFRMTSILASQKNARTLSSCKLKYQRSADPLRDKAKTAPSWHYGAGAINPSEAINPGLIFDAGFTNYVQFLCAVPGVDEESVRRVIGVGCPTPSSEWSSDLNTPSVTVANLVGSRRVIRKVTSVSHDQKTYKAAVRSPAGVSVTVTPNVFTIVPNTSMTLTILLDAVEVTNAYTFGEVVLNGDRKNVVRIPVVVFVSSTLR